jgi:hypothetical protein
MSGNLQAKYLGVPIVYESTFQFDPKILIPKFEELAKNPKFKNFGGASIGLELGDAGSTAFEETTELFPHNLPELKEFSDWVVKCSKEIFDEWGIPSEEPKINRSWVNKHSTGGWTNWHIHENVDLVLAAYVQAFPGSGDLYMVDPLENYWFGMRTTRNNVLPCTSKVPVVSNKVIFFAPFIRHATAKNQTSVDRWVISLNIMRD